MGLKSIFVSKKKRLEIKRENISSAYDSYLSDVVGYHNSLVRTQPLLLCSYRLEARIVNFDRHRTKILEDWSASYKKMSWWNKLKHDEEPDMSEFDARYERIKNQKVSFDQKYEQDLERVKLRLIDGLKRAENRLLNCRDTAMCLIDISKGVDIDEKKLLQKAFWVGLFSVPISVANDLETSDEVFRALRNVHGRFAEMSDAEIWWEALFLPAESLAGLASLTKGAYFEQLVAQDLGGTLFEHFNNPQIDITIDGMEYQIKATDNLSYIETVNADIPVIATSEMAELEGLLDGGYSNAELTQSIDLVLGGTVVDLPDTAADILLAGVGVLGVFASINGINHAAEHYKKDKDLFGALIDGFSVAVVGTLKSIVNLAELIWKIIVSAPIRFVGRTFLSLVKGVIKVIQFFVPSV